MQKLYIAKSRNGNWYTKIVNKYQKCEKLVSVNLPINTTLNSNYGTYDCEYYLSCYKKKDGGTEVVINVTRIVSPFTPTENPYEVYNKPNDPEIPF